MKNFTKFSLLTFILATILFTSCKKEYESAQTVDDAAIQSYLKSNNISMDKSSTGYYYKINTTGTGDAVKNSDSIYYSYTFKTLGGTVLNQTSDLMIPGTFLGYTDRFTIGGTPYVFTPIREVLAMLKRGGKATLILPSNQAFGKNGLSAINVGSNENILIDLGIYNFTKKYEVDEYEINKFIADKGLTMTKDASRARYSITTPGTGTDAINVNSTIVANYTVRNLDGTVVDSSTDGTFSSALSGLYKGWQLILPGKVTAGGKLRLIIPSDLANGVALDFDIEIVSVTN
ncbi:FKBP-type peptidyl-prolyl cis-trans isomerase [Pedobacter jamesrossensis]|uniref:Peptidyl-prolyl cis-trans isomerase n=1 Tax=Pedobacter jamesrossensis TaxID=1908238 RepID=A0ABV8NE01_9SPHI